MANDFSANPWFIDTVFSASTDFPMTLHSVYVHRITWTEQAAGGDELIIKDRNGKVIMQAKAANANDTQHFQIETWSRGIQVPTLASGKVFIHV